MRLVAEQEASGIPDLEGNTTQWLTRLSGCFSLYKKYMQVTTALKKGNWFIRICALGAALPDIPNDDGQEIIYRVSIL